MPTIDSFKLKQIFRPAVYPPGKIRWMEEGDIVSFTNPKVHFDNAEFQINNQEHWLIWFSQLYTKFYTGDLDSPNACSLKMKDGTLYAPMYLSFPKFWNIVRGRKFRVHIDPTPCFCVNKKSPKIKTLPFNRIDEIYEYVHNKLVEGKIDEVRGMLKPTSCYDLEEI